MANSWEGLLDAWDPILRRAFLESVYNMRNRAQIDQIARMLDRGDVEGAIRAVGLDPVSFRPLDKAIGEAFEAGGKATANLVPVTRDPAGFRTIFEFGIRNPVAEAWLTNHSATLVREIIDDQRGMIRTALTEGLARGVNPRTSALDLVGRISAATGRREGGTLGLTRSQEEWVRRYADELASDKPGAALQRNLRDKRFDGAVRRAAKAGEPVPAELREKMVRAYRNRALRHRAEALARTEVMAALHSAQEEAMRQALERGAISESALTYAWRTARDKRVRDSHRTMEGQRKRHGELFTTGSGARLRFPGDPEGEAAEIINCRCWREPNVDFLAGVT